MPAVEANVFLNTGARGPIPRPVARVWQETIDQELTRGRQGPWFAEARRKARVDVRHGFARLLGAEPENVALTTSTTDAMNVVLLGLDWNPGDEIVTTDSEFPSLYAALALLASRFGVIVRTVRAPTRAEVSSREQADQTFLRRLDVALTGRTRLLALSHVLYNTGLRLPLRSICEIAADRKSAVLCDGAQSLGATPVDVATDGVDYYAFPGQKWLAGPEGIGGLYVAPSRISAPRPSPTRTAEVADLAGRFEPKAAALRFECASFDLPRLSAMAAAIAWLEAAGLEFAHRRGHALAQRFVRGLDAIRGVRILSPEGHTNLVGFELGGWRDTAAVAQLRSDGFLVRRVPGNLLRISFGYFNLESEVDRLLEAIARLAAEPPKAPLATAAEAGAASED